MASEPAVLLAADITSQALGDAVLNALMSTAVDVATPTTADYRVMHAPLLPIAKVRSWNALERVASLCEISQRGVEIVVEPTRNGGTRGEDRGYHPLPEHAVKVDARCSAEELGAAVRAAFQRCQVPPNQGMELTGLKRHTLCKNEEQRVRRFSPAAHAQR